MTAEHENQGEDELDPLGLVVLAQMMVNQMVAEGLTEDDLLQVGAHILNLLHRCHSDPVRATEMIMEARGTLALLVDPLVRQ